MSSNKLIEQDRLADFVTAIFVSAGSEAGIAAKVAHHLVAEVRHAVRPRNPVVEHDVVGVRRNGRVGRGLRTAPRRSREHAAVHVDDVPDHHVAGQARRHPGWTSY